MNKLVFLSLAVVATVAVASDLPLQRCRSLADDRARLACYDAIPADNSTSQPTVMPPPLAQANDEASFGRPAPSAPAEALRSRVAGHFDGWEAKTVLRLENGQHWQIADGSRAAYLLDRPQVRITRGAFSGYVMVIEGVAQTPRVRRVN